MNPALPWPRWLACLALLGCALPRPGLAETLLVGPTAPSLTLAEALAKAADGDTIALMPGVYEGQQGVVTQQRLTIRAVAERDRKSVV